MKKTFITILILNSLLQSCSTKTVKKMESADTSDNKTSESIQSAYTDIPLIGYSNFTPINLYNLMPRYQNFQNTNNPKQSFLIANMIAVVQPEMDEKRRDQMAIMIAKISKRFNIEPEIMVSIIDTESNFQQNLVSTTGDLSIAQINVDVWNKEFKRLGLPVIDKNKVVTDLEYSLTFMAEILSVIKTRFAKTDPAWYARYHSGTPKFKNAYYQKLSFRLELIARSENLRNQIAQIDNIDLLNPILHYQSQNSSHNYLASVLSLEPMSTPETNTQQVDTKKDSMQYAKNLVFDIIQL